MNRDRLLEKVANEIWRADIGADYPATARVILDAILPQVTTVAELEALPVATKLIVDRNGAPLMRLGGEPPRFKVGHHEGVIWDADTVLHYASGPLTVVWRP